MDKKVLHLISYGVYVVSSRKGDKFNGQIANTVFQVTSEPVTIAISINKDNLTHEYIQESKNFSVSLLGTETPMTFIGKFGFKSGREIDKFSDTDYQIGELSTPIVLENALAFLEAKVINSVDVGTHTLFIGEVINGELLENGVPMTYEYYHQVKKGKSPKNAPTYIAEEKAKKGEEIQKPQEINRDKYKCTICGYVYDPELGDIGSGIEVGTSFENIPSDWVCPICSAGKDDFEKVEG